MDEETKDIIAEEETAEQPEEKSAEQLEETQGNHEKYTIYNTIKEHGGIIFGCGSAAITIVATSLKLASYLHHLAYLRKWDLDPSIVAERENYWLENVGLSFLFVISIIVYMLWITKLFGEKKPLRKELKQHKKHCKQLMKDERKKQKNNIRQRVKLERKSNEYSKEYLFSEKKALDKQLKKITATQDSLKKNYSEIKKGLFFLWFSSSVVILLVSAFCDCLLVMALLRIFNTIKTAVVAALIFNIMIVFLARFHVLTDAKFEKGDSILLSTSKHKLMSNRWIVMLTGAIVALCAVYVIYEYYSGDIEAKNQRVFRVTYHQKTPCAIIAFDTDYLIAEKVEISNDSATIITDEVYIISKENEPLIETVEFASPPKVIKGAKP